MGWEPQSPQMQATSNTPDIVTKIFLVIVPLQFAYAVFFNMIPREIRLPLAGFFLLVYVFLTVSSMAQRTGGWRFVSLAAVIIACVCWAIAIGIDPYVLDLRIILRDLVPMIAVIVVFSFPNALPIPLLRILVPTAMVLAAAQAFLGPAYLLGDTARLAPFTGGPDGIHSSAYFILGVILLTDQLRRINVWPPVLAWAVMGLGGVLLFLYKVRTAELMLITYVVVLWYLHLKNDPIVKITTRVVLYFGLFGIVALFLLSNEDLGGLGSGRVANYALRFEIMMGRTMHELLFGTGPGTDFFVGGLWHGAKGSHNDYIHVSIERGVIGLIGLILFLSGMIMRLNKVLSRAIVYAIITGSMVSNALIGRPANSIFFIWAMAVPLMSRPLQESNNRRLNTTEPHRRHDHPPRHRPVSSRR